MTQTVRDLSNTLLFARPPPNPLLPPLVVLGPGMDGITDTEGRTQFSLWCILAAPLMLGTDVRNASAYTLATIGNVEAIAINQDPLGVQGMILLPSAEVPTPYDGGFVINLTSCPPPAPVFQWTLTDDGHLQARDTNQCFTLFECATDAGSPVGSYDCVNNTCGNQLWSFEGGQVLTLAQGANKQCLTGDPTSSSTAPQLSIAPCSAGSPEQTWDLSADGTLSLAAASGGPVCAWLPGATSTINYYYKPLAPKGGTQPIALAVLNRGATGVPAQIFNLTDLGIAPSQMVVVRDIWADTTSAPQTGVFVTRPIDTHETLLLVITPVI